MAYRLLGVLFNIHFVATSWCGFFLEKFGTLFIALLVTILKLSGLILEFGSLV